MQHRRDQPAMAQAATESPFARLCRPLVVIAAASSLLGRAASQSQYFEVLEYRDPTQCERMQCMSVRSEYCREHSEGFYLREKGCRDGKICTDCEYGNFTHPTMCRCENPPFTIPVMYGQECNAGQVCMPGEGICFRPCDTYLHITLCEDAPHCRWNTSSYSCERKPPTVAAVMWVDMEPGNALAQGKQIYDSMSGDHFPVGFEDFKFSAKGYMIGGKLLEDIIQLESMFLQLDENNDGLLTAYEFAKLAGVLDQLEQTVAAQEAKAASTRRLVNHSDASMARTDPANNGTSTTSIAVSVTSAPTPPAVAVRPEACGAMFPRQYYCSFDQSCKADCQECGWKSATDTAFSMCVRPTPSACHADGNKEFCPSDQTCHPDGDCSQCVDRPIVDHSQHICLGLWWLPEPPIQWSYWVCRDRNKVGMPCRHDQDCIYGLKRCLGGKCQPLQPYNMNHTCESDFDCPHLGYYCPADPTGGEDIYWVQYCRVQKQENEVCKEDRQCQPNMRCNTAEPRPRCRRLFSLDIGTPAKMDALCSFAWRDRYNKCAPPAKSKQAGRSCDSSRDCQTTDETGRTGNCACKNWWDSDDSKYCLPVSGDYPRHWESLRDYYQFQSQNCGSFWTEEECLRIFGNQALALKLAVQCETQTLSGGAYLPPPDCNINDDERFPDYCRMEQEAR